MILRRFTKHVSDQNWFAVGLDFLVVVVGIFIGLQITDWNQERKDHQQGMYYIHFLHTYLDTSTGQVSKKIEDSNNIVKSSMQANMLLFEDSWDDEDFQNFQMLHSSAYRMWGPEQRPVALRQLIDGGKLDLIKPKEIQMAILEYETTLVEAIQQTRTSYNYSQPISLQITNNIHYKGRRIISTAEELRNNQALKSALRDKFIWQNIQLDVLKDIQKANNTLRDILAKFISEEGA